MPVDVITLKSLTLEGKHGYYDHERTGGNTFEIDLIAEGDFKPCSETDDLSLTFDYEKADQITREVIRGPSEKLIETLCLRIGERIFEAFPNIKNLTVALRKLDPPIESNADYAEICMKWNR